VGQSLVSSTGDVGSTKRGELRRPSRARSFQTHQKGVGSFRQQDGGHGSRNPPRSRVTTHLPNESALKMDGAKRVSICADTPPKE